MDGTGDTNAVDFILRQSHLGGNGAGKVSRADLVTGRIGVARLHSVYTDILYVLTCAIFSIGLTSAIRKCSTG